MMLSAKLPSQPNPPSNAESLAARWWLSPSLRPKAERI